MDTEGTLSVVEVAALMGVSARAVRARIHRGTLPAQRVVGAHGGEWRVHTRDVTVGTAYQRTDIPTRRDEEVVTALREEVAWLRAEVEAHRVHAERLTSALQTEQARAMAMLPPPGDPTSRPWWRFWKR